MTASTVSGRVIAEARPKRTRASSSASGTTGISFPVRTREKTLSDSSGVPSGAKKAWLSTAQPP